MRILCGLVQATSGSAYLGGISVVENPDAIKKSWGTCQKTIRSRKTSGS